MELRPLHLIGSYSTNYCEMTRNLSIALISCAVVGLSFFSIKQVGSIVKKNELLVKQDQYITELKTVSKEDDSVIIDLRSENQVLKDQIHILTDSIDFLNNTIAILERSSRQQTRAINDVKSQLELYQSRFEQLEIEMEEAKVMVYPDNPKDAKKIADLEKEKLDLLAQVKELEAQKLSYENLRAENEMELLYKQSAEANYQRISKIMNNTQVQFNRISIHQKRNSKSLKKMRKKWNYTKVELELIYDDPRILMKQRFIVKIVDKDTQEILKTIEEGAGEGKTFRDFETIGAMVQFSGDKINLSFYNDKQKTGQNYEVQVFYLDNSGKEYLLRHGTKQFVENGKMM